MSRLNAARGWGLALYALPALPLALPTLPFTVLVPAWYAGPLGLGLGAVALALGAARLLDVFTDPLIGALSDRTRRRKEWMAAGAPLAGLGLVMLLAPPVEAPGPLWLFGWSLLLTLGWTMVQIPYLAWGAEASGDYHVRARIAGARESAGVLGILGAGGVVAGAAALGLGEAEGFALLAWLAVGLGALTLLPLLLGVAAPRGQAVTAGSWRALGRNAPFLRLVAAWVLNGLATGIPASLFPFFVTWVLDLGKAAEGLFLVLYFLAAVAGVPLWLRVARRLEKHRAWCAAMLAACAAFAVVPLLGPGDGLAFGLVCLVTGLALGADLALPPAMQADVVDYGTLREGAARPGLYFALWSMATKLALALAVVVALPAVGAVGFDPALDTQAPGALVGLAMIYAGLPVVLKLGAVALVWGHPLTAGRHAVIRRRLEQRQP